MVSLVLFKHNIQTTGHSEVHEQKIQTAAPHVPELMTCYFILVISSRVIFLDLSKLIKWWRTFHCTLWLVKSLMMTELDEENLCCIPSTSHYQNCVGPVPAGTSVRWVLGWSATTFPAWWTSNVSCASGTQTSCSLSARVPKSGSKSASTSLDTTGGTAAHWTETTQCLAEWCWEVSLQMCAWDFYLCGSEYVCYRGCLC